MAFYVPCFWVHQQQPHHASFGLPSGSPLYPPPDASTPPHLAPDQHPASQPSTASYQIRIKTLETHLQTVETQLADAQREKATASAALQRLLDALATPKKLDCSECSVLRLRLAVCKKTNRQLKIRLSQIVKSFFSKATTGCHGVSPRQGQSPTEGLISTDEDLLGGMIPASVIDSYPPASTFNTQTASDGTCRTISNSDDEESTDGEVEHLDHAPPAGTRTRRDGFGPKKDDSTVKGQVVAAASADRQESLSNRLPYVKYFGSSGGGSTRIAFEKVWNGKVVIAAAAKASEKQSQPSISSAACTSHDRAPGSVEVVSEPRHAPKSTVPSTASKLAGLPIEISSDTVEPNTFPNSVRTGSRSDPSTDSSATLVNWNSRSEDKIFATAAERETAIAINRGVAGASDLAFPDLFRYGIRDEPHHREPNVYRTVLIENIPATIPFATVLNKVRGGNLISAKLLDTTPITGFCTALITFLRESAASAYEEFAASNPIVFHDQAAKVSVLTTPTWPEPMPLQRAIFDHHHTRCLQVANFPRQIRPTTLQQHLRICPSMDCVMIEHLQMREDGILEIRFSSVRAAGQAFGILTTHSQYRQCRVIFSPDPCAWPLSTLLPKVKDPSDGRPACAENGADGERLAGGKAEKRSDACAGGSPPRDTDEDLDGAQFADDEGTGEDETGVHAG